jgi:hypothetical protein
MGLLEKLKERQGKGPNKSIKIGSARDVSGFGYITIPEDIDRDAYIRSVRETSLIMITTASSQVIKNVHVPNHIIGSLIFPEKPDIAGQRVHWINVPKSNQLVITGIHQQTDEFRTNNEENSFIDSQVINSNIITISKVFTDNFHYLISLLNQTSDSGQVAIKAASNAVKEIKQSILTLKANGDSSLYGSKSVIVKSHELIKFTCGVPDKTTEINITQDELKFIDRFENLIRIAENLIEIKAKDGKIKLGNDPQQKAALGNTLQTELNKNKTRFDTLIQAIQTAPIVAQDGGASFKAALVVAIQTMVSENYSEILSDEILLT